MRWANGILTVRRLMHDELYKRVQRLIRERGMTLRAAETVVMAAMHSVGCVEGEVRERIAFEQSTTKNNDLLKRLEDKP